MSVSTLFGVFAPYIGALVAALLTALAVGLLVVFTPHLHGRLTLDHPGSVQTAHHHPTPRVGGLGIFIGVAIAWAALPAGEAREMLGVVLMAGLPAWVFGLAEDLSKRVSVMARLLATMFSGALACLISGVALTRIDIPLIDVLLTWWPLAVVFTAFAVGGVANAVNMIDGFHGLASGTGILALCALAVLAQLAGDPSLALVCLAVAAAVTGFWLLNYPWGKIFLGDGGAYFTGFALAWLSVLLPMRNAEVSPWASLLVCAYPFIEAVYSMLRRRLQRRSMGEPDSQHLHSLLASEVIRRNTPWLPKTLQNAAVAPLIWLFVAALVWLAITLRASTGWLVFCMAGAVILYHLSYRFLAARRTRSQPPHEPPLPVNPQG
jgi:UDP-N-acetylmuramyl pentapeptide phosphotransferase/UDP-N-acetylglucosamine-1-phosphate transferase